ncbi:hypothetical protein C1645_831534 [Glomus cerebriforme]|uniref:Uncharacterized protein n=1 Tax=Glomus cerebriforme TaxID=658196 RepID=A0A397SJ85_9GLOM|nr:hypothetical protein C1645_831534 [Glomus cerebriforme]
MNFSEFFRGYRRSEPTILYGLKLFIMIILMICLTGYLAVIIIDVMQDSPIIRTSFVSVDAVHAPNLYFLSNYVFNVSCLGNYQESFVDFSTDITQPEKLLGIVDAYMGKYIPSNDILFKKGSLTHILCDIFIKENIQPDKLFHMDVRAFDSKYDLYDKKIDELSPNDDSILNLNLYQMIPGQTYEFIYFRVIRELIKPSWMNDFGVPPTYEQQPIISSNILSNPRMKEDDNNSMVFIVRPKYENIVQVDKEIRTQTYLGGMGLIGGAWGLAVALYGILFGADTLRPWGLVQLYCCGFSRATQKKLKTTLPVVPFFDSSNPDNKHYPALPLAKKNELRIDGLELFLQEYVVDVSYLDKIRNLNINDQIVVGSDTNSTNSTSNTTVVTTSSQQ